MMTKTFAVKLLNRQQRSDLFTWQKIREIDDGFALSCRADIGNLIDLQPVQPAAIGEDEHIAVRIRDEDLGYGIFVSRLHPDAAFAAAALVAVDGKRRPLQIAACVTVMTTSSSAMRSSMLISPSSSMICVRRSSPYFF